MLVVGAPEKDVSGQTDAGRAYIFRLEPNGTWTEAGSLGTDSPAGTDLAGTWVDIDGGVVIAGVPKFDPESTNNGGGFVTASFAETSGGASLQYMVSLTNPFLHTDHVGSPVAATDADGNVVGAAGDAPRAGRDSTRTASEMHRIRSANVRP